MRDLLMMGGASSPRRPWQPCSRMFSGNLCGIYAPNLPAVPGGAKNPELVLSWFLDRYSQQNQLRIRAGWNARGLTDVIVSWPDSRAVGATPESFAAWCWELYQAGFEPCVMLLSKDYDAYLPLDEILRRVTPVVQALTRKVGRWGAGWELNADELFGKRPEVLQQYLDALAPMITPWGGRLYVHFYPGYFAWQPNGKNTADFWNANIGKLTGIFHQRDLSWDMPMYQARIVDCLERFAGRDGFSPDSGFGHPWDFIAWEITATLAYNDNMSEADQNRWADDAMSTPPVDGPEGRVSVMGSGNGVWSPRQRASYVMGGHPMLSGAILPAHPNM